MLGKSGSKKQSLANIDKNGSGFACKVLLYTANMDVLQILINLFFSYHVHLSKREEKCCTYTTEFSNGTKYSMSTFVND
jgi:hypothetical protein